MKEIMKTANGVGLAANQVGENLSLFVIDEEVAKQNEVSSIYINPEVKIYSKELIINEEGCLSIPEKWLNIKRAKKVKMKAIDENGEKIKFIAKGLLARIFQHEFDHLNGKLITDRK